MDTCIRIMRIAINDFKNIEHGEIIFSCNNNEIDMNTADILGIYGQNGSGKTSLIQAIELLKLLLMGKQIPEKFIGFIHINKDECKLEFELLIDSKSELHYKVLYCVTLGRTEYVRENVDSEALINSINQKVIIKNETLHVLNYSSKNATKLHPLIECDYIASEVFTPKTKLDIFSGCKKDVVIELLAYKKIAQEKSQSFIFSRQTLVSFKKNCSELVYVKILDALVGFGNFNLFVIDTKDIGLINLNLAIPFSFKLIDGDKISIGNIAIKLNESTTIPTEIYDTVKKSIENMNTVLIELIPGLSVDIIELGSQLLKDGSKAHTVELASIRGNHRIPLSYESEGIKKIISILQMLIVMYNSPSVTVAIDELDAGIFEYLLGELLKIISEAGKGQLIFTSHNLRPLEVLNKKYICFTSTNPRNRFIRMKKVQKNNNLRDFYYHDIVLGGQNENIYDTTNNFAIALAFKRAGDFSGC